MPPNFLFTGKKEALRGFWNPTSILSLFFKLHIMDNDDYIHTHIKKDDNYRSDLLLDQFITLINWPRVRICDNFLFLPY